MSKDCSTIGNLYRSIEEPTPEQNLEFDGNVSPQSVPLVQLSGYSEPVHEAAEMLTEEINGHGQEALHEDMEMSSGMSGNDLNEIYSSSHDSSGNESQSNVSLENSNGKDSAMLVESSESHKSASSNAFSLMMASSEHNPSTSGCSSEQPAKAKNQKELMKTLKELRMFLPPEKRTKGKSSILATLKYALRCIKQVKANGEYYQLLMFSENPSSSPDVSSYTVEEVENITSEYTLKNADMFAVAVSLITGKIMYISDQAACILHCKKDVFKDAKFVEFLAPKDVGVFYSSTTPCRLPSWSICNGVVSSTQDCMQEKSFFCRIRGGREHEHKICYQPFRMTPYLTKVQETKSAEDQLCCVCFAERVHSGYEAPRIPPDKRIFTTTHTPNCLFQDVDERAVPLLGYLPQDLIGEPMLVHLHPSDRPLMLAIHKKILQHGGQPFDYSPIRFCTRNGEYITIDTSWSSFINPWSRKVSFIIGRHKVRTGPVNEDVFAALNVTEEKVLHPSIQKITEQIYRLLLQPVHNSGSSGYGSLGSNGSREHLMSVTSSSDSNGNINDDRYKSKPSTFQTICKDVHLVKNQGQQVFIESRAKLEAKKKLAEKQIEPNVQTKELMVPSGKDAASVTSRKNIITQELTYKQPSNSYQQINCLDSVIRYLEGCSVPTLGKRRCESSSNATSSNSDDEKHKATDSAVQLCGAHLDSAVLKTSDKSKGPPVVGAALAPLALPGKAESVVSFTSQCSYSSTIVHVGDKKPQPELEMMEDVSLGTELPDSQPLFPPSSTSPANQEESFKKLGLTKEVLALHTQKEEQSFLSRFKELRRFSGFELHCLQEGQKGRAGERVIRRPRNGPSGMECSWKKGRKNRKSKSKRIKQQESSGSTTSGTKQPHRSPLIGLNSTAWSPSETSQASYPPMPFPAVLPAYPLPVFPAAGAVPQVAEVSVSGINKPHGSQNSNCPMQPQPFSTPLMTPMVALVLPNCLFPQMNNSLPQAFYPSQPHFSTHPTPQTVFSTQSPFTTPTPFPTQTLYPTQPFHYNPPANHEKAPGTASRDGPSRSSTPQSVGAQDQVSPPLFQSRCSSPLQLNLLQLEETPRASERQDGGAAGGTAEGSGPSSVNSTEATSRKDCELVGSPMEAQNSDAPNSDAHSMSSDLLDILLQEDACSGTGSASSGSGVSAATESLASGSNVRDISGSRTGSSETSHTSKYFGSIDSSETNHKSIKSTNMEESDHFMKYVLQDPIWLLMANADDAVMMTYQIPSQNMESILQEDREKLRLMQKFQPKFTEDQKKELVEVHTWMQKGGLPKAIDVAECIYCGDNLKDSVYASYDEELQDLDLHGMIEPSEENGLSSMNLVPEQQSYTFQAVQK
ncbi:LOW QUALITY PROTEIN: period circadian protein homolog 2 [Rhinatrema bivittatum]|uniref:LOW QUALITY PROTEIN: period circadian protein homolog 2 n=1 Tax=Rhinatrema bivittatum TaxID=194408 RepID=UPI00112AA298|nr:LOW QUALITY PROTEIN: period circadian protein homolog 2 [Rhinatrema bivittatum]